VEESFAAAYAQDKKCTFDAAAVWNQTGYVTFYIDPLNMMGTGGGVFTKEKPILRPTHKTVRSISMEDILKDHKVTEEDFVVLKLDVEGGEWLILKHMAERDMFRLVDEIFLECHSVDWNPRWGTVDGTTLADCHNMFDALRGKGVYIHEWY
jgi:FkbM family methyltransferase